MPTTQDPMATGNIGPDKAPAPAKGGTKK